jgi:hypothetical protein
MNIDKNSSYYERLEYAELAKLKTEYEELGFEIHEEYAVRVDSDRSLRCDLFMENKVTGEKIVYEVKARRKGIINEQTKALVERRREIKKAIPGVKFFMRVIEEPKKQENKFYGIENLIGYLLKFKHAKELHDKIPSEFVISNFRDVNLTSIKLERERMVLKGSAYAEIIFKINNEQNNSDLPDILYFNFTITTNDRFFLWDYPYFLHVSYFSEARDSIIDKGVKSEFVFDLQEFY